MRPLLESFAANRQQGFRDLSKWLTINDEVNRKRLAAT
jgi:hypothetical protein